MFPNYIIIVKEIFQMDNELVRHLEAQDWIIRQPSDMYALRNRRYCRSKYKLMKQQAILYSEGDI
jgi:hypothetical protein